MFLIWFANLDQPTKLARNQPVQESFPHDLISGISGELQSLSGINKKIKDLDKSLTDRVHSIEREQTYYRFIALIIMLFFGAIVTNWIREGGVARTFSLVPPAQLVAPVSANAVPAAKSKSTATTAPLPGNTVERLCSVGKTC